MKRRSFLQVGVLAAADGSAAHITGGASLYSTLLGEQGRHDTTSPYPVPRSIRQTDILVGNGGKFYGPFDGFQIFDHEDVVVWSRASADAAFERVAVTVAKMRGLSFDFFSIEFAENLPETTQFVVSSERTAERLVGIKHGTMLDAMALEKELSKQATVLQELRRDLDRALKVQFNHPPVSMPGAQDNHVLGWQEGGLTNIDPIEFVSADRFATPNQGVKADTAWQPTVADDVFGSAINSARIYGRVRDTVSILDYATTKEQRDAVRNGNVGFKAAFDDASADALDRGIAVVNFPNGNFELGDAQVLNNPGLYIRGEAGATFLYKNGPGRMFQTLGTAPDVTTDGYPLTVSALAGATSLTLSTSDAAGLAAGQTAIIRSTNISSGLVSRDAEFVNIEAVNTQTGLVTLSAPLYFAYAVANTPKLFNSPLISGVGYENLIVDWSDGGSTSRQRPPYFVDEVFTAFFCEAPRFINVASKKTISRTILLHGCMDAYIAGLRVKDGFSDNYDMASAFSYGVSEAGINIGTVVTGTHALRSRHAYTTEAADSTDATMFNGGHPMGSLVTKCLAREMKAAGFDTHGTGREIKFQDCHVWGAVAAGFQLRSFGTRVLDCSARSIRLNSGTQGHGLYILGDLSNDLHAQNVRIDGFTAISCEGAGVWDQAQGTVAKNLTLEETKDCGIVWSSSVAGDGEYSDIYMRDVAAAALGGGYAIVLGNASLQKNPRLRNVFVDDPNSNLTSLVRRKNSATDQVEITNVRGLNARKKPIEVFNDPSTTANAMIRGGYGTSGTNIGPISTVWIARDSINADSLYAAGAFLLPQTGTVDSLAVITGGERDGVVVLWGSGGNVITLIHGTRLDNLVLKGAVNANLQGNQNIAFMRRGSVWIELWRNF